MSEKIQLAEVSVDVVRKEIKSLHLSVYPPIGRVRISAPARMKLETIRVYAIGKLKWIREQQRKFREQKRETPREYIQRESHYLWGKRYLLNVTVADKAPAIQLLHSRIHLQVRPNTTTDQREAIFNEWLRKTLREQLEPLLKKWEGILKVKASGWGVRRMKTKWGSCNTVAKRVLFNTELVKKPKESLEYVVIHELSHLIERRHNDRFIEVLNKSLPNWRQHRNHLNALPLDPQFWRS